MDSAGRSRLSRALVLCLFFVLCCRPVRVQAESVSYIQELAKEKRWEDVIVAVDRSGNASPDLQFMKGTALSQLKRWSEARAAFEAGRKQSPGDKRFSQELAGIAFQQKQYSRAAKEMRRALALDRQDPYANDFLGTVYFLQGNLPAALKFWNRIGKPKVQEIRTVPRPTRNPVLLDRAFAFSPASLLGKEEFYTTEQRLRALEIFPWYHLDLEARQDGDFDVLFRHHELNGWGDTKYEALFRVFRGLPFQTLYPEYFNLGGRGINLISLLRWDAQKRRAFGTLSGPFRGSSKYRYELSADLRSENWELLSSFTGPALFRGGFNFRRAALSGGISSIESGRWSWSAKAEFSHRNFRDIAFGSGLMPALLPKGYQLKQSSQLTFELWRVPEQRLTLSSGAGYELGRLWAGSGETFLKLRPELRLHWLPQSQGDDYEMVQQIRAGKTFGDLPFDELAMLGVERDNDLWLRGHIGTRDGRKGSAPLGRNYFLSNFEMDKKVYSNGLLIIKIGPFVDTGKITDPVIRLGPRKWLWDVGVQSKFQVFGVGVGFSYGKDLRTGNNALYVSMQR
ncbi:MAG TPA: tetratricopeptide repeat protein [Terriglobales bacterium]|nr:tetratricopeptide repeat protein [Terriglobales bacterium]